MTADELDAGIAGLVRVGALMRSGMPFAELDQATLKDLEEFAGRMRNLPKPEFEAALGHIAGKVVQWLGWAAEICELSPAGLIEQVLATETR